MDVYGVLTFQLIPEGLGSIFRVLSQKTILHFGINSYSDTSVSDPVHSENREVTISTGFDCNESIKIVFNKYSNGFGTGVDRGSEMCYSSRQVLIRGIRMEMGKK